MHVNSRNEGSNVADDVTGVRYICSPRHMMQVNSINEGVNVVDDVARVAVVSPSESWVSESIPWAWEARTGCARCGAMASTAAATRVSMSDTCGSLMRSPRPGGLSA